MSTNQQICINGLISDNKAAIDKIYQQYHKKIYFFAKSYLKMEDEAADIVQEVFIKVWEKRHTLSPETNLDAFIFTITRNTVISVFRKKLSEKKYVDFLMSMAIDNPEVTENEVTFNLLEEKVDDLVNQLPEKRKEVYSLSRNEGLSNKEIAQRLGISEKTVEDHMTKALAYLRQHLVAMNMMGALYYFLLIG